MDFVSGSIKVLRAGGYRITQPRRRVLELLEQVEMPLSPYDIQKKLREMGQHLDTVTIYRILDLLCGLGLTHKVLSANGFIRCTLGDEGGCHRYLVCRRCGGLQEFADEALCLKEDEIAHRFGFQAEYHLTEFSGLCANCQGEG
jgi:Fe2+ or Zn2+ uptake regulation protein